jgi:hypothetical protein
MTESKNKITANAEQWYLVSFINFFMLFAPDKIFNLYISVISITYRIVTLTNQTQLLNSLFQNL